MNTKIVIDSRVNALFSSYYIHGLTEIFGKNNISFSSSKKLFGGIDWFGDTHANDHYMPFVVFDNNSKKKIIIDFRDKTSIKESAYEWCDHYAKININRDCIETKFTDKLVSIPPAFGIQVWNSYQTAYHCIINLIKSNFSVPVTYRRYFGLYWLQYKRPRIEEYTKNVEVTSKYIFFISSLWRYSNTIKTTNLWRKAYIEFCFFKEKIVFEGGFYSKPDNPQYNEYKKFVFHERYTVLDYLEKSKKSVMVFNTPSVHNCHGWKLGEFFAMGKAIVSTPLSNELPKELKNNMDIHIVHEVQDLSLAIDKIASDDEYRIMLEDASKRYFNEYSSPESVIRLII